MATFAGGNDEQLAAGAAIGGLASLIGPTTSHAAALSAKYIGIKCGALGALKTGICMGLASNPWLAGLAVIGGIGYMIHKANK